MKLEEAKCALTASILTPANLDSMLPLLPNENISMMDNKPNTDELFGQSKQKPNQLRHIKSKLYKEMTKIKNVLIPNPSNLSTK